MLGAPVDHVRGRGMHASWLSAQSATPSDRYASLKPGSCSSAVCRLSIAVWIEPRRSSHDAPEPPPPTSSNFFYTHRNDDGVNTATGELIHWCDLNGIWAANVELPNHDPLDTAPSDTVGTTLTKHQQVLSGLLDRLEPAEGEIKTVD